MSAPFDIIPVRSFTASSSTGLLITCAQHSLLNGTRVQFVAGGGLPGNLSADTTYFVRDSNYQVYPNNNTTFKVSTTIDGAAVAYSSPGTAPNYFEAFNNRACTVDSSTDTITSAAHGFANGDKVQFYASTMPGGLSENVTYFIVNSATDTFQVEATVGGGAINVTSNGTDLHWCFVKTVAVTATAATDILTVPATTIPIYNQPFRVAGTAVPGGLSANTTYYANPQSGTTLKVMASPSAASNIDITSTGTSVVIEYVEKNVVGIEYLPKSLIQMGRYEVGCYSYRPPPSAGVIAKGTIIDGITGTLSAGGGESWG